jgi:hypothetical protein
MSFSSKSPHEKRGGSQSVTNQGDVSLGMTNPKEQYKGAEEEAQSYSSSYVETGGKPV